MKPPYAPDPGQYQGPMDINGNVIEPPEPGDCQRCPKYIDTCDECEREDPGDEPGWCITVYNNPQRSGLVCPECVLRRGIRRGGQAIDPLEFECGNPHHPRGPWHPSTPVPYTLWESLVQWIRRKRWGCGCAP
ncbi:MAG: hypothetical protein ACYTEX_11065 [Planctomycetota bacterium]